MNLSTLAGNNQIKAQLAHREGGRGLGHAYIISGAPGSGKHTLARLLSAAMVCQQEGGSRPCGQCQPCKKAAGGIHPDIITITGPEGKPISVDQVRALRTDAHIRPNEAQRKVYLLERADRMNQSAQNAMLKLLEEGPAYAAFLLLAENSGGLLTTIRSRCESLALIPVPVQQCQSWLEGRYPNEDSARIRRAALDCQGILGRAVEELEGNGAAAATLRETAAHLARVLENGDELTLFETTMALEKLSREELAGVLEHTVVEIGRILPQSAQKHRLLKAVELLRKLRGAAELNANAGQLTGWLCAAMFQE